MKHLHSWKLGAIGLLLGGALLFLSCQKENPVGAKQSGFENSTLAKSDERAPDVPAILRVSDTCRVAFHVYARGVQIYTCNGTAWVFKAPDARLSADAGGNGVVGKHYAGPTWESVSGSKVVGSRLQGVTVDSTAIPWLLLKAGIKQGPGIFADVKFIQRVNTTGGLAPTTGCDGSHSGDEAHVPYTAEYYFYR